MCHLQLKCIQCDKQYWITNPGAKYLAYVGDTHCCSIETVTETRQASSVTASRTFPVTIVPLQLDIGLNSEAKFHHIDPQFMDFFDNQENNFR